MTKQIKPEEVQNIPAINYYASKEELIIAIRENSKEMDEKFEKIRKDSDEKFEKMEAKFDEKFKTYIITMIGGFVSMLIGLYLKH